MDNEEKRPADLTRVLIDRETIARRVREIAGKIDRDYAGGGKPLLLVGVLKGAFLFLADLCRELTVPHVVDFIAVSSYGDSVETTGNVRLLMDTRENQAGRDVLIVEDIVDSGYTLGYLERLFRTRGARSVRSCVLLDKPSRRVAEVDIAYKGFEVPDAWVVGYGLDVGERYRTLPYIAEYGGRKKIAGEGQNGD
ncbi:MAG: hypoxanthine phosphoribosyltransferase [Kiritimatiellae bacterium]|nr:hypoxanthine phosphoribosyltransferase [Kiritimatiellia bacterium]